MTSILLIEDEKKIRTIVEKYLEKENFQVQSTDNGQDAIKLFDSHKFDLVILDRMLPDLSGDEILSYIREKSSIPIIMLTAMVEEKEIIQGFRIGADDYVTKPFRPAELIERIKALLRRSGFTGQKKNILRYSKGNFIINLDNNTIIKNGHTIGLTKNEFQIVRVLFENPNKIFTRNEIIATAFGSDYDAFDRAIDTHIKNIRQKIEDNPKKPRYIQTVYGIGYKAGDLN